MGSCGLVEAYSGFPISVVRPLLCSSFFPAGTPANLSPSFLVGSFKFVGFNRIDQLLQSHYLNNKSTFWVA